ncbi:hypothetical protein FQN57_006035 [Myotisia sp. PD_48]|nr:hypothetical protein FQN57_006035 [Myotisia sp. PD_48]
MSKAITCHALAHMLEEVNLSLDTRLIDVVPELHHSDPTIQQQTTITDILSHRTGLASQHVFLMQEYGRLSIPQSETPNIFSHLPVVHDFRSKWLYSNWGYGLAAMLFPTLRGNSWGSYLQSSLFDPLGMTRTTTQRNPEFENVAKGYLTLEDGTPFENERPHICDGSTMSGAAGVQSSVTDLLKFYKSLLQSAEDQKSRNATSTPGSPFKYLSDILSVKIATNGANDGKRGYGLGWTITQLPAPLGDEGVNGMSVAQMPIVGRDGNKTLVYHHNGSLAGYLSAVHLIPDTQSAIVVLTNALAKNDCADWLAQLILEALLGIHDKNDYEKIAEDSAWASINNWKAMEQRLAHNRTSGTTPTVPIASFVGEYYNEANNLFLEVFEDSNKDLHLCIQGDRRESYKLEHYHHNVFSWYLTWDESVKRGRFRILSPDYYLLNFSVRGDDVVSLQWATDGDIPQGQTFLKKTSHQTLQLMVENTEL